MAALANVTAKPAFRLLCISIGVILLGAAIHLEISTRKAKELGSSVDIATWSPDLIAYIGQRLLAFGAVYTAMAALSCSLIMNSVALNRNDLRFFMRLGAWLALFALGWHTFFVLGDIMGHRSEQAVLATIEKNSSRLTFLLLLYPSTLGLVHYMNRTKRRFGETATPIEPTTGTQ